jgi:perosamine synthetase
MIPVFRPVFGDEEKTLLNEVVASGRLTEGKKTEEFESLLREFLGVDYVVTLPSGGVALYLSLLAVGVKSGDDVIIPDYQHISLANAVTAIGARPFFMDTDYNDGCLRWQRLAGNIRQSTTALGLVHMNGRYCCMEEIDEIVDNRFPIVEDACQAFPSTYEGHHLCGDIGCLSFHPTKWWITTGNGGAVFTNSKGLYEDVKKMKDYGRFVDRQVTGEIPDLYDSWGLNYRFTEMQAAIGISQFHRLDEKIKRVKEIRYRYSEYLAPKLIPSFNGGHVPWVIDIRLEKGQNVLMKSLLAERGIETRLPYTPVHHQPLYDTGLEFLGSDTWNETCLWLPSSPSLTDEEIDSVIQNVNEVYEELTNG